MEKRELTKEEVTAELQSVHILVMALGALQKVSHDWIEGKTKGGSGFVASEILAFMQKEMDSNTEVGLLLKELDTAAEVIMEMKESMKDDTVGGVC